ncbi:MAG: glycosyl hydrolase, partial [Thermoguttaceae bacterium]
MTRSCLVVFSIMGAMLGLFGVGHGMAAESTALRAIFADPPREYSSGPLWVWNDMLSEEQVSGTMRDLAGQNVKQVFVHPRPGLMTPYLSADWFRLWKVALEEAKRLDMNVWIYDEDSYPSGFAGGLVPAAMPESRGRGLFFTAVKRPEKPGADVLAVFRLSDGGCEEVTARARAGEALPDGSYLVAAVRRAPNSPWHGGKCYVDLLYPGVTQKFLEITLGAYEREIGSQFGKRVPGSFCDEPNLIPAGGMPWTDDLPVQFRKRWGYDLTHNLASLARPVGDWKRIRHNYFQVLLELMIERWSKPYSEYCRDHGLEFTGHYWEHEWPAAMAVPDNMAVYAWPQRPAIDCLRNQYTEQVHAQFGNARMVKELSSVANQLGKKRTLCESYGASGWDIRFEDMKRIGDWLYVLGINTLDQHLSSITIRGARKWDYPQSFSYHEPWWKAYHVLAGYFTRLSAAMSQGEQINSVLLIEPTTSAWIYQLHDFDFYEKPFRQDPHMKEIGDQFQNLVNLLERSQVEYDIGCEDILVRHGKVLTDTKPPRLAVGRRVYGTIILPPCTENLNEKTMRLIEAYVKSGGRVLGCGAPPQLVDGRKSERGQAAAQGAGWKPVPPEAIPAELQAVPGDEFAIHRSPGDKGILFHHRRQLDDGELLLLVNTSIEWPSSGEVASPLHGAEQWDLESGRIAPYRTESDPPGMKLSFRLPPCGSLLLFLSRAPGSAEASAAPAPEVPWARLAAAGPLAIRRMEPNVLTLDYLDVTAGGETKKNVYCYLGCQFAFQKNGMPQNPWESAVQFRDELITRKFPPESGCAATYRFTIEGEVPRPLHVVIERPDLYAIVCNGTALTPEAGSWWLDKSFGRIDVTAAAKTGANEVTIRARPFTMFHELAAAYVLGDFSLKVAGCGFTIAPPIPLKLGKWNEQGLPLYSAVVGYRQRFELPQPSGRYAVRLPAWYGSVAEVFVNGRSAGYIGFAPWQCDVTKHVVAGVNTIEVRVIGTLKNTLG